MTFKLTMLIFSGLLMAGCASTKVSTSYSTLMATELKPFGRSFIDDRQQLHLIGSAVHAGFTFNGTQCAVYASLPAAGIHNYLQYEIDGVYQGRLKVNGNVSTPIILQAKLPGKHTVWIYKATEAQTGDILIEKVTGNNLQVLQVPDAPIIEFIGNSITCGAAADASEVACGTGVYHDQHNAFYAYGPRVARSLQVNYLVNSVSGIGMYRNWNSNGPTMPQVYEKLGLQYNDPTNWNFNTYSPTIVSIALGTNDFSRGDGKTARQPFDSAAFVLAYVQFVKTIKVKYPKAQIALLSSAMVNGADRLLLQNCLTAVKNQIDGSFATAKPVATFFFEPMQARGCNGHPSVEDHAVLAKQLEPFYKELL